MREDFDASFQETAALHGLRTARTLWQAMQARVARFRRRAAPPRDQLRSRAAGSADLHAPRRRTPPDGCSAIPGTPRGGARSQLGDAARARARDGPRGAGGAIRTSGAALDPYRACVAFAAAAAASRRRASTSSLAVRRIRAGRKEVEITTAGGHRQRRHGLDRDGRAARLTCGRCGGISAPGTATPSSPNRCRRRSVATSAAARPPCATATTPPHVLRWLKDDRVLFAGADQPAVAPRARDKALVQRTGQLMYELSTLYPAISGHSSRVGLGFRALRNRGRPAGRRAAPQFSAAFVRAGGQAATARALPGWPRGSSAPAPGRGRQGRRAVRVHSGALKRLRPGERPTSTLRARSTRRLLTIRLRPRGTPRPERSRAQQTANPARAARPRWPPTASSDIEHLLRRAGFGASRQEIDAYVGPRLRRPPSAAWSTYEAVPDDVDERSGSPGTSAITARSGFQPDDEHHRRAPALAVPDGAHASARSRRRWRSSGTTTSPRPTRRSRASSAPTKATRMHGGEAVRGSRRRQGTARAVPRVSRSATSATCWSRSRRIPRCSSGSTAARTSGRGRRRTSRAS